MTKSSKETAHYRGHPNGLAQCAGCTMFVPANGCTAVEGDISPRGWCSYYESVAAALKKAERQTDRNPSEAAKEAGNYAKGKLTAHGLPITIENPKGSKREGVDKGGKPWSVTMPAAYGYVRGSLGRDGDHVDVYLGPDHKSQKAYIVDQVDAKTGAFDEHKALLSYPSKAAALADYKAAFSDGRGAARIGGVKETTVAKFRDWIKDGATTKPAARQAFASGGRVGLASGGAYWGNHPEWTRLSGIERAAAMALLEADRRDFDSAKNALGAMLNRAHREGKDLGEHVSGRIYQPTIEPTQFARLRSVLGTPEHKRLMELAERRMSGAEPDWVQGATHFLAPESQMLRLSAGVRPNPRGEGYVGNSGKYYSWPQWTQYNPAFGYRNVVLRDKSHAFVAPEGRYSADYGSRPAAVAEAPPSNGWQSPPLSGSIAFGGEPPRAEWPAPMAAGLREVPPVPVERPVSRPSVPEFDARSFFDSLDRSSYKSGGTVAMPIIKSGSKQAVSANIKAELKAGKPRDQAIAIALSTARRYGKGKANGGPVGYADGGAPDKTYGPFGEEYAVEQAQTYPFKQFAKDVYNVAGPPLPNLVADYLGVERTPGMSEVRPIPSTGDAVKEIATRGLGATPGMGGTAVGTLGKLVEYGTPAALGITATMGDWFSPAQAADQSKADPTETLRRSLEQLQTQREKQQAIADKAKERQDAARPKNRAPMEPTRDPRTGRVTGDAKFFEAKREYDEAMAEARRLGTDIRETEKQLSEATKTQVDTAGGESLKKQLGEKSLLQSALPYAAPILGGGLGYLGGMGMKGLTKFLDKSGVEAANKLLPGGGKAKPINQRIGSINDFWMKGGSGKPPFSEAGNAPWWKANQKDVAPPHSLYPPRSRALDWTANTGLTGVYAGEAALGYKWGDDAHQELKAAREAFAEDKNEGNVQRLLKAERDVDIADAMLRMGLAGTLAQGVKGSIGIAGTPSPRPNISKAETERADIRQALAASKAKAKAKAERSGGQGSSKKQSSKPPSPNGAAHLLPLGLLPLAGSTGDLEPPPSPSLASSDSEIEPPYAGGGEVKKHWSFFQPRDKLRRFKGGPVYPKNTKDSSGIGKGNTNRTPGEDGEFKRGGLVSRALEVARKYARGGRVLVGPVVGATGGRTDALPVDVPAGAFVIPADVVSHLGENNTASGFEKLTKMFGKPAARKGGDKVPIRISPGEFVVDPEQVAKLGNGDMEQGHKVLDQLVLKIRREHVKTLTNLPPPASS